MSHLTDEEFRRLLALRTALRQIDHDSETRARAVGLTHMQHQLLLAVRGHPDERGPTIGELASALLLRHHSAVELANRAVTGGWTQRHKDTDDARVVRLRLTPAGEEALSRLAGLHRAELERLAPLSAELDDDEDDEATGTTG